MEQKKTKRRADEASAEARRAEAAEEPVAGEPSAEAPIEVPAEEPIEVPAAEPSAEEPAEPSAAEPFAAESPAAEMPLSPAAMAAFAKLLAALSEEDKGMLLALLTRLREMAAQQRAAARAAEEERCLAAMAGEAAFYDLQAQAAPMQALIAATPWLQALPTRTRLETACYLCRGMAQHAPTPEEKLAAVLGDPALLRALAEKQAALRAAGAAMIPPVSHGGRAPALAPEKPKTLAQAKQDAKRYLRAQG